MSRRAFQLALACCGESKRDQEGSGGIRRAQTGSNRVRGSRTELQGKRRAVERVRTHNSWRDRECWIARVGWKPQDAANNGG